MKNEFINFGGIAMNLKRLVHMFKLPCPQCPYTLGYVKCVVSPCPMCKLNNYETYHLLIRLNEGRRNDVPKIILKD